MFGIRPYSSGSVEVRSYVCFTLALGLVQKDLSEAASIAGGFSFCWQRDVLEMLQLCKFA